MNYHIGIVEDDPNIQNIVTAYLKKEGFIITTLNSAEEALKIKDLNPPDMWILDIMLPGMDGFELCKRIRNHSNVPIIIISAKDEEIDKILGLELGGDDYLTKPFSPRELVARVKRLFRRTYPSPENENQIEKIKVNDLLIYPTERRVFWLHTEVDVTTKEFDILLLLVESPNHAFSREELLVKIWGNDYYGSDRAVDDLIKRIRKKLVDVPIETVWGYGYRLRTEAL